MATLPQGYSFVDGPSIRVDEVLVLRRSVGWSDDGAERWINCLSQSLYVCGVRAGEQLVGIGFVAGNLRHAVFCDLCVHIDHQKKGIASALFERRLEWIKEQEIPYLYTSLSAANPLRRRYREAGFFIAQD